jgi:hypothetical protein
MTVHRGATVIAARVDRLGADAPRLMTDDNGRTRARQTLIAAEPLLPRCLTRLTAPGPGFAPGGSHRTAFIGTDFYTRL